MRAALFLRTVWAVRLAAALALMVAAPAMAGSGEGGLADILEGFEETGPTVEGEAGRLKGVLPSGLGGSITLGASYNYAHTAPATDETDYRGLSRLRLELDLKFRRALSGAWRFLVSGRGFYDLAYSINGRGGYTDEVLREYEREAEFREAYIQGSVLRNLDVKIGRQTVVWGKAEGIRVTDVLNPLENREPGIVDLEDLRLPLCMSRVDYYLGPWNLTVLAVHEIRFDRTPVFGSDFFPRDTPLPPEDVPQGTEFAVALNGMFTGWDASLYWASIYDDRPHIEEVEEVEALRHSRLAMLGAAVNVARGNWLLISEAAWFDGLEFKALPGGKKSRIDLLAGVEYSGLTDATVSLEAVNRHINGFEDAMEDLPDSSKEDEFQWALRYRRDFMRERLQAAVIVSAFGLKGEGGAFQHYSVRYALTDSVALTAGLVDYKSGDLAWFKDIGGNDRLFFEARHSF